MMPPMQIESEARKLADVLLGIFSWGNVASAGKVQVYDAQLGRFLYMGDVPVPGTNYAPMKRIVVLPAGAIRNSPEDKTDLLSICHKAAERLSNDTPSIFYGESPEGVISLAWPVPRSEVPPHILTSPVVSR